MNNEESRIAQFAPKSPRVTWRGATLLILIALWTCGFWYWGYDYGSGEPDRLQAKIDKVTETNSLLSDQVDSHNKELMKMDEEHTKAIIDWELKHRALQSKKAVSASTCKGEDDYYGTNAADRFQLDLNKLKEGWLREKD